MRLRVFLLMLVACGPPPPASQSGPAAALHEVDADAHALADKIAAAAASESGMLPAHLFEVANRVAGDRKLAESAVPPRRMTSLDPAYGPALFAIKDIGKSSPAVRTRW